MARGDAELAAVMRKLLADGGDAELRPQPQHLEVQLCEHPFYLVVDGLVDVTEDEAHAIEEARRG